MLVKRFIVAATIFAAVLVGGLSVAGAQSERRAVRVWMTTGDQKNLLTEQPSSALTAPVAGAPTVTIDPSTSYQPIEGFGASITDSSAHVLAASPHRDQIHCYYGDPSSQSVLHDAFPDKAIYFTECTGSLSSNPSTTFSDTLHWHTRFLTVGAVRNWARTVITWNLALDPSGGPHNGGCGSCFGVVTIDPQTGQATPTADYYVLGHVTRFVRPGAVRIGSNVAGNIWNVAFRNPDGTIVLLANDDDWGTGSQTFNVRLGRREFSYNLPAGAAATFVIPRSSRP